MIAKAEAPKKIQPRKEEPKPEPKKKRRGWTGATAGLTLGLAGLAATRLGQLWIAFDIFAQFTAQFAALTAAFGLALLMPRFKVLAALVIFVALLAAYGAWPHVQSQKRTDFATPAAPPPGERWLKIASYNTHQSNRDFAAQEKAIRVLDADVVVLIEFDEGKKPILEALKDIYPNRFDCFSEQYCNLAILSRLPMTGATGQGIWQGPPSIRANLGPDYGNLTIVGVHTTRFPHPRAQLHQIQALVKSLEAITTPIILAGDINATPWSRVTQTVVSGVGLVRHTNLPTFPAWAELPQLSIDHIFASQGLRAVTNEVIGDPGGSDHFPIAMTFAVKAP